MREEEGSHVAVEIGLAAGVTRQDLRVESVTLEEVRGLGMGGQEKAS